MRAVCNMFQAAAPRQDPGPLEVEEFADRLQDAARD